MTLKYSSSTLRSHSLSFKRVKLPSLLPAAHRHFPGPSFPLRQFQNDYLNERDLEGLQSTERPAFAQEENVYRK